MSFSMHTVPCTVLRRLSEKSMPNIEFYEKYLHKIIIGMLLQGAIVS